MSIEQTINKINDFVKQFNFYEFSIYHYSKEKLIVVGSPEMSYYHNLEIHFNNIFYLETKCSWIVDTGKPILQSLQNIELFEFNKENKIEVGNYTVQFLDQDNLKFYYTFATIEVVDGITKYY